jgi:hypothetical protein
MFSAMTVLYFLFGFIVLIIVYIFIIRPWHLRWGAFDNELEFKYPGDEIVLKPDFNATRGITINASSSKVWKWIIQIGSKRAGWYSIDWMDNGGTHSSETILTEHQKIYPEQFIPFTPDQKNGMWVKEFKENQYILWIDKQGNATWIWYLIPSGPNTTRLITKLRTRYIWTNIWIIYYLIYDIADIIMMSKCMKGIKIRAEKNQT